MRKSLIIILIVLLIALSVYIGLQGFEVGEIEVLSYQNILKRDEDLDSVIQRASKLVQTDYKTALNNVQNNTKELIKQREKYDELTLVSTEGDIMKSKQLEVYDVDTLWVKLGNHATAEGVTLKMDVKNGSSGLENYYNLEFEVNGSYITITDFISDIENDSELGFRIEEFEMVPVVEADLRATFVCKDIAISKISSISPSSSSSSTNTTNTTNTTNSTSTTNSTNSTNSNTTNNTSNTTNTAQ